MLESLEPMFDAVHPWISPVVALSAIASAYIGNRAMQRGLEYNTMAATAFVLLSFAIGRTWHTIYEMANFEAGEFLEYLTYLAGYVAFWVLAYRSWKVADVARKVNAK